MKKVKIDLRAREWIELNDYGIMVKPFISTVDQASIINVYLKEYFNEKEEVYIRHFNAENVLLLSVLEMQTNMIVTEVSGDKHVPVISMDSVFENYDLIEKIEKCIINFQDFKRRLLKAVENEREERRLNSSLPTVLENIYNGFSILMQEDISSERMQELKSLLGDINSSELYKNALKIYKD